MSFEPCNRLLKIRESIDTPSPKVGVTFSYTLGSMRYDSRASLLARNLAIPFALVASPRLVF
jgi:hypothetical protein